MTNRRVLKICTKKPFKLRAILSLFVLDINLDRTWLREIAEDKTPISLQYCASYHDVTNRSDEDATELSC